MSRYIDTEKIKYSYLPLAVMPDVFVTKKEIDEMPSEDVAPVIHGKWVYHYRLGKFVCIDCGFEQKHKPTFRYCPNCGAKMYEKEKE